MLLLSDLIRWCQPLFFMMFLGNYLPCAKCLMRFPSPAYLCMYIIFRQHFNAKAAHISKLICKKKRILTQVIKEKCDAKKMEYEKKFLFLTFWKILKFDGAGRFFSVLAFVNTPFLPHAWNNGCTLHQVQWSFNSGNVWTRKKSLLIW